jgi:flagellar motor switch protein FliN/FliY
VPLRVGVNVGDSNSTDADEPTVLQQETVSQIKRQQVKRESQPAKPQANTNVNVKAIQFENFIEDEDNNDTPAQMNLDLVMDVELNVTVEIGHAKKPVKEVLNMAKGSIIELDKKSGDPVDIIVNGQLIAKGDVVVIDDNFGVRITKLVGNKL